VAKGGGEVVKRKAVRTESKKQKVDERSLFNEIQLKRGEWQFLFLVAICHGQ